MITFNYVENNGNKGHLEVKVLNGIAYDRIPSFAKRFLDMKKKGASIEGKIHFYNNGFSGDVDAV